MMTPEEVTIQKRRDFYVMKPSEEIKDFCPTGNTEYGRYLREMFGFDVPSGHSLLGLGWTAGEFRPLFEGKILEDTEREVLRNLGILMPGGGFIFGSTNSVQYGAKTENYLRALEIVQEKGRY